MSVLQLGCGIRPIDGAVNHDKTKHADFVDVVWDLDVTPWLWQNDEFDKVIALDVMEHLQLEVYEWLDECWRILKPDGLLVLRLPAWNHENSHIDPTHRRLFHPRTFEYWDKSKELFANYGAFTYAASDKWWTIERTEMMDNGANIFFVLRKEIA